MRKSFIIEPMADGRWHLKQWPAVSLDSSHGVFETEGDAKKAANNLSRETIFYTPPEIV